MVSIGSHVILTVQVFLHLYLLVQVQKQLSEQFMVIVAVLR